MRTIITLSRQQEIMLNEIAREEKIPRTRVIQRAIDKYVAARKGKITLSEDPAFGSWKKKKINSLKFQNKLRDEWK